MKEVIDLLKKALGILEEESEKEKVLLADLNPGDAFKIGEHDFIVLKQEATQTKVISKGLMRQDFKFDDESRDYNESRLKRVIESEIQLLIEAEIGSENIVTHSVQLTSVDMQNEFGDWTGKVRPLTFDEVRDFNDLLVDEELPDWYWTLTPWSTKDRGHTYSIAVVSPRGRIGNCYCNYNCGVRPFCILKSNIFVSKGE